MTETAAPPAGEQITVTIRGYTFQLLAPYAPGQPLGIAEAGLLNKEWTNAVRIAFQGIVEASIDHSDTGLSHQQIAQLQVQFQHLADEFSFKALPQSRNSDPLLRQKHSIAQRIMDIRLNSTGQTRATFGESRYQSALARLMNNPEVVRQAEEQLAATRDAADQLAGMESPSG